MVGGVADPKDVHIQTPSIHGYEMGSLQVIKGLEVEYPGGSVSSQALTRGRQEV